MDKKQGLVKIRYSLKANSGNNEFIFLLKSLLCY
jgi:hypothetical protein